MHAPKNTKYRKQQKGKSVAIESNLSKPFEMCFGKYGIKSLRPSRLKANTIEAVRRVITRKLRRSGQVWIRIFPDLSITSKPLEVRMGKGKGNVDHWASRVKMGQIIYEIDGVSYALAKQAASLAASKLPIPTSFVRLC